METEKTRLQKIMEQKAEQIRVAIEQAMDDGAKIEKSCSFCLTIDDILLQKDSNGGYATVLHFDSEKIAKAFGPSKDELEREAARKRAELEEIEEKLKRLNNETDHN